MFAAIAGESLLGHTLFTILCLLLGKRETVECLLRSGADTNAVNKLGKTASNMAAFVGTCDSPSSLAVCTIVLYLPAGQHECAQLISNFFSSSELMDYTLLGSDGQKPHLSPALVQPLHHLLTSTHLHPVKASQLFFTGVPW